MLLFVSALLPCVSCQHHGNWIDEGDGFASCTSRENSNIWIMVSKNGEMMITLRDFSKTLPDDGKLEVSFDDNESLTFQLINGMNRKNHFLIDSSDGFFGIDNGDLLIIILDRKFYNALFRHKECRITSRIITNSYTFNIEGLARVL